MRTKSIYGILGSVFVFFAFMSCRNNSDTSPNILICIADDASHPHAGRNCSWIRTSAFDRISEEGIYYSNAFTPNAKCAPSRACLLTGRNPWQLKAAANMWCYFPSEFKTFMEVLEESGYHVGYTGKGWGPGEAGMIDGKPRELTGRAWNQKRSPPPTTGISNIDYASNFREFYEQRPDGKPFCFWYGAREPHRKYEYASSLKSGRDISEIDQVPAFFPDNEIVRTDMLDYGMEIEHFDLHIQRMLDILEEKDELDNTLIVVTSDHGMPFPRAKTDAYNYSNHVFLAIMWKKGIKHPGSVVDDYVSFVDLAPTFLDLAGVDWEDSGMKPSPGKSLKTIFMDPLREGSIRDHVLIGKEKHGVGRPGDYGYPIRGMVRDNWLYLVNYRNDLWPAGNPEAGYADVGGSPTKTEVLKMRHHPGTRYLWELSFGKREKEELYHLVEDPCCMKNLAGDDSYSRIREAMKMIMENELKEQQDPRMFGYGDVFQEYESSNKQVMNYYERLVIKKEEVSLPWVNDSDIENDLME